MSRFVALLFMLCFVSSPAYADRLEVSVMDDGSIVHDYEDKRLPALAWANYMQAEVVRINITRQTYLREGWKPFDDAIAEAAASGLPVQATITELTYPRIRSMRHPEEFVQFVGMAAWRYREAVKRYSIFNEPNCCGKARHVLGRSVGQMYRRIYLPSYKLIKSISPESEVLIGELSGRHHPLRFLNQLLCLDGKDRHSCRPLMADGFAYHPYRFTRPPDAGGAPADVVDISRLDRLNEVLDWAYEDGALQTPEGERLPIFLTEFGYHSRSEANWQDANLSDKKRAKWLPEAFQVACETPHVVQMTQYQLFRSAPETGGNWDTSIIDDDNQPDQAYWALRKWIDKHPECIDRKPLELPTPTPIPPPS